MKLAAISGLDPDTLPYFVQLPDRTPLRVAFASLTPADGVVLSLPPWDSAVFAASWPAYIGNGNARKLVSTDLADTAIYGMICVGKLAVFRSSRFLQNSLLETAPNYRYNRFVTGRPVTGVGRVLVARLVAESYRHGSGRVAVHPRPGSEAFYRRLGFAPIASGFYALSDATAASLFEKATG